MGFLKWIEKKFTGEVRAEYGPVSTDYYGMSVSASLRQMRNGKYYFVFKREGKGTVEWFAMEATPPFLERMAVILQDSKTRVGAA